MMVEELLNMYRRRIRQDVEETWDFFLAKYPLNRLYKNDFIEIFKEPEWSWDLLHFSKKDLRIYQAAMNYACLTSDTAALMYDYQLYMNEEDKERLYQAIINKNPLTFYAFQHNIEFRNEQDRKQYLINSFAGSNNVEEALCKYYKYFDEELKDIALLHLYHLSDYWIINLFSKENIAYEFKEKIFDEFYSEPHKYNYQKIFQHICNCQHSGQIRKICFDFIIDKSTWEYWSSFKGKNVLTEHEVKSIYKQWGHHILDSEERKFDVYYHNCLFFGKFLDKEQRTKLIKMLKAKTRHKYIEYALDHIIFDDQERQVLLAIKCMDELQ